MDNKQKKDFRDRTRINPEEEYEVQYWAKEFGVSAEQLREAVKAAGPMVEDVRKRLKK